MSEIPGTDTGLEKPQNTGGEATQAPEANGSGTENNPTPVSTKGSNGEDTTGSNSSTDVKNEYGKPAPEGTEGGKASSHQATGTEGQGGATLTTEKATSTQEVLEGLKGTLTE